MSHVFNAALQHLSIKDITANTLRFVLEKEFLSLADVDTKIDATLKRLQELNLLDDASIATKYAKQHQYKGNRFIKQSLQQKGIDAQSIDKAISTLPSEYERATETTQKKLRTLQGETKQTKDNKILQLLSNQGFGGDVCYQIIDTLIKDTY